MGSSSHSFLAMVSAMPAMYWDLLILGFRSALDNSSAGAAANLFVLMTDGSAIASEITVVNACAMVDAS